jgi:hypothetical protein
MSVGILTLHLLIPACSSLKEKRSRIKPLLARLHREFNISVAEVDQQDLWGSTIIACVMVSNARAYTERALQVIVDWVEQSWPDLEVVGEKIEILSYGGTRWT